MVLSSQSTRPGTGRRYMVSRRRRRWKKPTAIAGVLAIALVSYLVFGGDDEGGAVTPAGAQPSPAAAGASVTNAANSGGASGGGRTQPTPAAATQPRAAAPRPAAAQSTDRTPSPARAGTNAGQPAAARPAAPTPPPATAPRSQPQTQPQTQPTPPPAAAPTPAPSTTPRRPAKRPKTRLADAGSTNAADAPSQPIPLRAVTRRPATFGEAMALVQQGNKVEARARFSRFLTDPNARLTPDEARFIRETLTRINEDLIFSPRVTPGDPLVASHMVKSGEFLSVIGRKYRTPWRLLERINNVSANRVRAGKPVKVIRGPFHAMVTKSDYRMDIYLDDPAPGSHDRIYIRSFTVGLGENDSTPVGFWVVEKGRKLINPPWTNPRTGQFFAADNPLNPIGERWLGLKGTDATTQGLRGYGIHGTIDPDSIGKQRSMGCVRMGHDDVCLIYDLLYEGVSTVEVRR